MQRRPLLITWLIAMAVVALSLLLDSNLLSNEADKLPLALRQVWPQWLPQDWYLAWPQSHQWVFQAIAGWPLRWLGFPLGSLLDRLLGYGLWSLGFTAVAVRLGLWPVSSALALALFLPRQGLVAGEWMVGGAESKTWAYGLLLLAFALWCSGRRLKLAALLAGLACSFHALVGLYGAAGLLLLELLRRVRQPSPQWLSATPLLFAFAVGGFALLQPLVQQLHWGQSSAGGLQAGVPAVSWIYVYLRLPHHLSPLGWPSAHWAAALAPLLALLLTAALWSWIRRRRRAWFERAGLQPGVMAAFGGWVLAAVALFALGLLVAPFDPQGRWLRFYPFRLADSLLPLLLALLLAALAQVLLARWQLGRWVACGLAVLLLMQAPAVSSGAVWRPAEAFAAPAQRQALNSAILRFTPSASVILTPPQGFQDLPWRLQRSPVVQFKLFPSQSEAIVQWYRRLVAASGSPPDQSGALGFAATPSLLEGYGRLTPHQLKVLAERYGAAAVVTTAQQSGPMGWRRKFFDQRWALWLPEQVALASSDRAAAMLMTPGTIRPNGAPARPRARAPH